MLVNPCNIGATVSNTGVECNDALRATSLIFLVPKTDSFTQSDIVSAGSFTALAIARCHAAPALRWLPLFGSSAPVRSIVDSNKADVIEELEDGSQQFILRGVFNRTFLTTEGGHCYAKHLAKIIGSNYGFIEVDIDSKVALKVKPNGSYTGFPTGLAYSPSPDLANFKISFKNKYMLSFRYDDYITNGTILASDGTEDILDVTGLLDTAVTAAIGATQSTTNIFVNVESVCGDTDMVELYPGSATAGAMAQITNFVVALSVSPFTVITPTAALAIVPGANPGQVKLTGTFASASSYTVKLAPSATLLANGIEGYDGGNTAAAIITIP